MIYIYAGSTLDLPWCVLPCVPIQLCITYTAFGGEPIALLSAGRRFVGSSASTSIVLRPEETRFTPAALHAQTNYHIHGRRGTTPTLESEVPGGAADGYVFSWEGVAA